MRKTLKERLEEKLVPGKDGCLEFTGFCTRWGYGTIRGAHGKMQYAHRVAWELENGVIPSGLCVLHHCDNPSCSNPEHLFLGTNDENVADKVQKGRQGRTGNYGACRKVDADMSHLMFTLAAAGHVQGDIGKRLGVDRTTVSKYLSGKLVAS